jgi:hypothetical protein
MGSAAVTKFRRLTVLLSLFAGAGCFSLQPVTGGVAPEAGARVDVTLNDAGRAALGSSIGPAVDRIDGTVLEQDSSGMTLAVKHIIGLNGSVQVWSDELVRVEESQYRMLALRRFSRGRTVALGAGSVGGFALLIAAGVNPFGFIGNDAGGGKDSTPGESIIRVIRP